VAEVEALRLKQDGATLAEVAEVAVVLMAVLVVVMVAVLVTQVTFRLVAATTVLLALLEVQPQEELAVLVIKELLVL
jgi:Flp pilus assembly pilin Flp